MKNRILFIDDEFSPEGDTDDSFGSYMSLYKLELTDEGYDVDPSNNVDDAWDKLNSKKYDLVIIDIMMPPGKLFQAVDTKRGVRVGYHLAKKVLELFADMPIILLSAVANIDHSEDFSEPGSTIKIVSKLEATPSYFCEIVASILESKGS